MKWLKKYLSIGEAKIMPEFRKMLIFDTQNVHDKPKENLYAK